MIMNYLNFYVVVSGRDMFFLMFFFFNFFSSYYTGINRPVT